MLSWAQGNHKTGAVIEVQKSNLRNAPSWYERTVSSAALGDESVSMAQTRNCDTARSLSAGG